MPFTGREMRSTIDSDGTLRLTLDMVETADPGADEIVVRIEAAPINPSDLGLLLGPADVSTAMPRDGGLDFSVPKPRLVAVGARLGRSMPIGNEGAGTVVAAGGNAQHLMGKRVGMIGGAMFADYRRIAAHDVIQLPEGTSAADGAAMFVNPLTALGFVETARAEGHSAIVHTAAASNLGQMLQKLCAAEGIPLVNIVRSAEQAAILRDLGARYVLNSRDEGFSAQLAAAIAETGATIAFDAIGGGMLGTEILRGMERAAVAKMDEYSRYGSDVFKQLYVYGVLDPQPIVLERLGFGFQWSVGGWLLFPYLRKIGAEGNARLRQRVVDGLATTFASRYSRVIGLAEALQPEVLAAYERKATGEKYLIDPTRD